jgi:hypothetical protein
MLIPEKWSYRCLIACPLLVTISLTVLTGWWAIAASVIAVMLGILSGGFYAASIWHAEKSKNRAETKNK